MTTRVSGALLGQGADAVEAGVQSRVDRQSRMAQELVAGDEKLALQAPLVGHDFIEQGRGPEGANGGALRLSRRHLLEQLPGGAEFQAVDVLEGLAQFSLAFQGDGSRCYRPHLGPELRRGLLRPHNWSRDR